MESDPLQKELARFGRGSSLDEALTPPSSWYTDPAFLQLERQTVFQHNWLAVGRSDQVRRPGAFFSGCFLGEPWVVVRDACGALRAFANVCRHHAALVAPGEGQAEELVCPYHGWVYSLDGSLKRAPGLGRSVPLRAEERGLPPLAVAQWGPVVFLRFGDGPPLEEVLAPLGACFDTVWLDGLRFHGRRSWEVQCNWKVFVDNYLDGGYHIAHIHASLAEQLDLDAYRTELFERVSIQSCPGSSGVAGGRIGRKAHYAFVHPHFMINRYGDALDTNAVFPLGPDRCRVVFDFWFQEDSMAEDSAAHRRSIAVAYAIQEEDVAISEAVQRGLGSSAFDQGRYGAPERGAHHFHSLLAADLDSDQEGRRTGG